MNRMRHLLHIPSIPFILSDTEEPRAHGRVATAESRASPAVPAKRPQSYSAA